MMPTMILPLSLLTQETKEFPTDIQKGKKGNNSIYINIVWNPQKKIS